MSAGEELMPVDDHRAALERAEFVAWQEGRQFEAAKRSALAVTRNPLLALPAGRRLAELEPAAKAVLIELLGELSADARRRADKAWRTHKGPMAVYWKAVAVYSTHTKRALRQAVTP